MIYALKELLEGKTADDILSLTVVEPAMGSAAFLNEAVNQLAEAYLERKQQELGQRIPHENWPREQVRPERNSRWMAELNQCSAALERAGLIPGNTGHSVRDIKSCIQVLIPLRKTEFECETPAPSRPPRLCQDSQEPSTETGNTKC